MTGKISLFFPFILRFQRRGVVDAAEEFQMVPELMAQDAAQKTLCFRWI